MRTAVIVTGSPEGAKVLVAIVETVSTLECGAPAEISRRAAMWVGQSVVIE